MHLPKLLLPVILALFFIKAQAIEINVMDRGAKPDSSTDNTEIIQRAIDDCGQNGGGSVIVPAGVFMSNQLLLRSGVNFLLLKNAIIRALPELNNLTGDNNSQRNALVLGLGIENASITGEGTLDGNGCLAKFQFGDNTKGRHYVVFFYDCKKMIVNDISLVNSCFWTFRILDCNNVMVNGIRIYSHCNLNNDGIDIDGKNIIVSNCNIDCEDDAICLKSDSKTSVCENVAISNCVISTNCNAIKFGTASNMGFRNIAISNIVIKRPSENHFHEYKIQQLTGVTAETTNNVGVTLQMVDGGVMDQVSISNIVMTDVLTPFMIKFGNRRNLPQYVRNINISNIIASGKSLMTSSITGFDGHYIENVKISNVILNCSGGGTDEHAAKIIDENEKAYPDNRQFGLIMPAYGLFVRHVKNITLDNIQFNLTSQDLRHAVVVEDADNIQINRVISSEHTGKASYLKLKDVRNAMVSGFTSTKPLQTFLKLEGNSSRIKLINNDFVGIKIITDVSGETISKQALTELNNIK